MNLLLWPRDNGPGEGENASKIPTGCKYGSSNDEIAYMQKLAFRFRRVVGVSTADEARELATRIMNQRSERAKKESEDKKQARSVVEKRRAFLDEYVERPLRDILEIFVSRGFIGDIQRQESDITAVIDGKSFRVRVEFRDALPSGYAMDGSSGPIRDSKEFAEMVRSSFVSHLRQSLK